MSFVVLLAALVFLYVLVLYSARLSEPYQEGEPMSACFVRFWRVYKMTWRSVLQSSFFWGAAGLATATLIFDSLR